MDNLHIVTVATESQYYFPYLVESCERHGQKLEVLGFDEKWQGFNWRFKKMINYLKTLPKNDIVCFVDGYDVVCTKDLKLLVTTFKNIKNEKKCKIIVGNDFVVNPMLRQVQNLFGKCKNKFINAGTYIGYAKDLLDILQYMHKYNSNNTADDQILLTNYCISFPHDIYVDIYNDIFLVIGHSFNDLKYKITFENNEIIYNNKFKPFFVHGPGSTYLDYIIKNIGCNHTDKNLIQNQIYKDYWNKKIYDLIKHHIKEKQSIILFIIILIIWISYYLTNKIKKIDVK